ncbi:MAG: cobalt ABC transporter ATP-binding protein [Anaerolineaceae bacterium]|nr:MAG: cobalt ABC transporter ATP-binding protein [Anaerolineaceae bacterium]
MTEALPLAVKDLSFRYRDRQETAIRNISFDVRAGEILLIAGASGCGKTTLIRCLNGLAPRSYKGEINGRVAVFGKDIQSWKLSQISQKIGTALQDPERQILGTKVVNEVAFGLENLNIPREEIFQRVDEALTFLKIFHLRERETFSLSGGEKQKLALAGILAMRPSILLLDEPLASLDPASAQDALDTARFLADQGITILMVEHRVEDVLRIKPERVMLMDSGEIRYLGDAAGLFNVASFREVKLPANVIVERAKAEAPPEEINLLPGATSADSNDEAIVKFENVAFGYESNVEVLHGLNLEIKRGDVIAVLGPNGAGKTTFVKHAIGLLKPKTGRVLVNGRDTKEISVAQIASVLGYVFQSPSHMLFAPTVREELAFGPTNLRHSDERIEMEVKEALRIVNLSDKENDPPLALSFGQQKRVSIAAILAMQSKILVMDEPTAGQDYQNYMNFMDSILQLPSFEAILFITHDVDLAVIYANRVLIVNDGRLVADGRPQDVLRDFDRLKANRLEATSLLRLNLERLGETGKFMRAEALAHL